MYTVKKPGWVHKSRYRERVHKRRCTEFHPEIFSYFNNFKSYSASSVQVSKWARFSIGNMNINPDVWTLMCFFSVDDWRRVFAQDVRFFTEPFGLFEQYVDIWFKKQTNFLLDNDQQKVSQSFHNILRFENSHGSTMVQKYKVLVYAMEKWERERALNSLNIPFLGNVATCC